MAKSSTKNPKGAGRKPLLDNKVKTSLYITGDNVRKLKIIEFIDDITRTDIINQSLEQYFKEWEEKNGPIPNLKK